MSYLSIILFLLAAICFGSTLVANMIVRRSTREARGTIFTIVREEETARAKRARFLTYLFGGMTLLFLISWLILPGQPQEEVAETQPTLSNEAAALTVATSFVVTATIPSLPPSPTFTAMPTSSPSPTGTATPIPTSVIVRSVSPINTPLPISLTLTLTTTFTLTPSSQATPKPTAVVAIISATRTTMPTKTLTPTKTTPGNLTLTPTATQIITSSLPSIKANIGTIQFTHTLTSNLRKIKPQTVFTADIKMIYAVFPFKEMENGSKFTMVWYLEGQELWREDEKWVWGNNGISYAYLKNSGLGKYELKLYVNNLFMTSGTLEIR